MQSTRICRSCRAGIAASPLAGFNRFKVRSLAERKEVNWIMIGSTPGWTKCAAICAAAFRRIHTGHGSGDLDHVIGQRVSRDRGFGRVGRKVITIHAFKHVQTQIAVESHCEGSDQDGQDSQHSPRFVAPEIGPDFFPAAAHEASPCRLPGFPPRACRRRDEEPRRVTLGFVRGAD